MTWRVGVILAITMVAMAVPLLGVALLARSYFQPARPAVATPAATPATEALAAQLERVADASLGGERVRLDDAVEAPLVIVTGDVTGRARRVVELAETAGGSVLEVPAEASGARAFIIYVPAARRDPLRRAILGENVDLPSIVVPGTAATELLRVELKQP